MKVYITEGNKETTVDIHCVSADEKTGRLKKYIEAYGMTLSGKADGETRVVPLKDILYFESVDGVHSSIPVTASLKRTKSCTSWRNGSIPVISTGAANPVSST